MRDGGRRAAIAFGRGLFVLRYASSEDTRDPPKVMVAVVGGSAAGVQLVAQPGSAPGQLFGVGDVLVIVADRAGTLDARIEPSRLGGSVNCSLALDRLGAREGGDVEAQVAARAMPSGAVAHERIVAHVARLGDVSVALGEWIAGPEAPQPIEGFALPQQLGEGVRIDSQGLAVGTTHWGDWVGAGDFVGSRGQARPLRGVRLRIVSPEGWLIRGEAQFLGAPLARQSGTSIEFVSAMPFDALVGLRIDLVRDPQRAQPMSVGRGQPAMAGRLKVFRSSRAS